MWMIVSKDGEKGLELESVYQGLEVGRNKPREEMRLCVCLCVCESE